MKQLSIVPAIRKAMIDRHNAHPEAFKGATLEGGKGRIWSTLGEETLYYHYPIIQAVNCKDYDFLLGGHTFDVKAKMRSGYPQADYDGTVDDSAIHQNTEFYIFMQIMAPKDLIKQDLETILNYPFETAYITGTMLKKDFLDKRTFHAKNSRDPSNGLKYREDCWTVKYGQCNTPEVFDAIAKQVARAKSPKKDKSAV